MRLYSEKGKQAEALACPDSVKSYLIIFSVVSHKLDLPPYPYQLSNETNLISIVQFSVPVRITGSGTTRALKSMGLAGNEA